MSRFERWSRRKRGEDVEEAADREPIEEETTSDGALIGDTQGDNSLDHTLPDPDELSAGADFSAYLQQGVSRQLRQRALRRLWSTGNYGVRDGLDDYDEDYREVLKPLARDMAEQLRRWTQPSEQTSPVPGSEDAEALAETPRPNDAQHAHENDAREASSEEASSREIAAEKRLDEKTIGGDNNFS